MLLRLEIFKVFICFLAVLAGAFEGSWGYGIIGAVLLYVALHVSWAFVKRSQGERFFMSRFIFAGLVHFIAFLEYSVALYNGPTKPESAGHMYIISWPILIMAFSFLAQGVFLLVEKVVTYAKR